MYYINHGYKHDVGTGEFTQHWLFISVQQPDPDGTTMNRETGFITFATVLSVTLSIKGISRLVIAEVVNDITLLDDRLALAFLKTNKEPFDPSNTRRKRQKWLCRLQTTLRTAPIWKRVARICCPSPDRSVCPVGGLPVTHTAPVPHEQLTCHLQAVSQPVNDPELV